MQGSSKLPKNQPNQPNQLINPSIHREKKNINPSHTQEPQAKKNSQRQGPARGKETTYPQVIQFVPFSSPNVGGKWPPTPHHKKVTLNHQANCYCFFF